MSGECLQDHWSSGLENEVYDNISLYLKSHIGCAIHVIGLRIFKLQSAQNFVFLGVHWVQ